MVLFLGMRRGIGIGEATKYISAIKAPKPSKRQEIHIFGVSVRSRNTTEGY
tara:strand:+ start:511 stop:663 length:153 start_codon:yes stop_codon:yes gene_type:complete